MAPVIIGVVPKKGALHGYRVKMSTAQRRSILMKVVNMESKLKKGSMSPQEKKRAGIVAVIRRLNLLAVYNKRNPEVVRVMRSDISYLQKQKDKIPVRKGYTLGKRAPAKKRQKKKSPNRR